MRDCEYVEINCPQECGRQVIKKNLQQHIGEDCPNSIVSCEHCREELIQNGLEVCTFHCLLSIIILHVVIEDCSGKLVISSYRQKLGRAGGGGGLGYCYSI